MVRGRWYVSVTHSKDSGLGSREQKATAVLHELITCAERLDVRREAIRRATDPKRAQQERLERPPHVLGAAAQRPYMLKTHMAARCPNLVYELSHE